MKIINLLLSIALCNLISVSTAAQLTKGSTWLGGTAGYSSNSSESQFAARTKTRAININPAVGKVVKPNLVAGIELAYNSSKETRNGSPFEVKNRSYGGGLFARKYIETFKRLYLFAHGGVGATVINGDVISSLPANSETKGWQGNISLYPGVSYMLTSRIFLEAAFINLFTLSYANSKTTILDDVYKNSSFSANANLNNAANFGIGIRFIIPGNDVKKTN